MKRRQWICCLSNAALLLIGVLLAACGLFVELSVFPSIIKKAIIEKKVLGLDKNGTLNDFTKIWASPSKESTIQYWAFDYRNTIGILNRALYPDMDEKGPYTYDEIIKNGNINFTDNQEKVQFSQSITYIFNPNKSCTTCDPKKDNITIPDISFFMGMQQIDMLIEKFIGNQTVTGICQMFLHEKCAEVLKLIQKEIGTFMTVFNTQPFITVTVDQLLFSGYVSPLVTNLADRIILIMNRLLGTKYPQIDASLYTIRLNMENGTTDTLYTVKTGKDDHSQIGYILHFENITNTSVASDGNKLPSQWWPAAKTPGCSSSALSLEGTNGDFFKSFIQKNDTLPVYIPDICRSIKIEFEKETTINDITAYRFLLPADVFNYTLPENCGFCNPKTLSRYGAYDRPVNSSCLPTGLLDISGCRKSPIILSKPHFYQASDIVRSFVPRFTPTRENDETTLDIEPKTGTILSAHKRLQINILINQFPKIGAYSVIRPGAYPLIWLNESFSLDHGTLNDLRSSIFRPEQIVNFVCWSAIGVGGFLMALSVTLCFINVGWFGYRETKKNN